MYRRSFRCFSAISLLSGLMACSCFAQTAADEMARRRTVVGPVSLTRHYRLGEKLSYHMNATNKGRYQTKAYEADVNCVVKKDTAGRFTEECAWTNLVVDKNPVALSPDAQSFRQTLSLDPNSPPSISNLGQVIPLIGPITDLLTFYSDLWLAGKLGQLHHVGDHFYFARGTPNSWADGNYVLLGQDSIDFDLTLSDESADKIATLLVRHVVPAKPEIKLSADWMQTPVADTPNNWVEVEKGDDGKFSAEVGKETFDVVLKVAADGKILSATLDNPVEVSARDCTDVELTHCGEPARYQIVRHIELTLAH
jgi:hypothetical protein